MTPPEQLAMEWPPRTRSTDPCTSHRAEARMKRSGKTVRQREQAAEIVRRWPERTATELARLSLCYDHTLGCALFADFSTNEVTRRYELCRRLPEVLKADPPLVARDRVTHGIECRWRPA